MVAILKWGPSVSKIYEIGILYFLELTPPPSSCRPRIDASLIKD